MLSLPQWMKTAIKRGFRHVYQFYAAAVPPSVAVLTFHEIHPAGSYTPDMFETLLAALAKRAEFLTLAEACARLRDGRPLSRHAVVLTFDDGLRDQFVYAYPLLQRYQAKATFFVVPGLMTERRWLWNREAQVRATAPAGRASRTAAEAVSRSASPTDPRGAADCVSRLVRAPSAQRPLCPSDLGGVATRGPQTHRNRLPLMEPHHFARLIRGAS